jgi:hypothetical protein
MSFPSINDDDELSREDYKYTRQNKHTISSSVLSSSSSSNNNLLPIINNNEPRQEYQLSQCNSADSCIKCIKLIESLIPMEDKYEALEKMYNDVKVLKMKLKLFSETSSSSSASSSYTNYTNTSIKLNVEVPTFDKSKHYLPRFVQNFEQILVTANIDKTQWGNLLVQKLIPDSEVRNDVYKLVISNKSWNDIVYLVNSKYKNIALESSAVKAYLDFRWTKSIGSVEDHSNEFLKLIEQSGKDLSNDLVKSSTLNDQTIITSFTKNAPQKLLNTIPHLHKAFSNWEMMIDSLKEAEADFNFKSKFVSTDISSKDTLQMNLDYHDESLNAGNDDGIPKEATVMFTKSRSGRGGDYNYRVGGRGGFRGSSGFRGRGGRGGGGVAGRSHRTINGTNACSFFLTPKGCFKAEKCTNSHDISTIADAYKSLHSTKSRSISENSADSKSSY